MRGVRGIIRYSAISGMILVLLSSAILVLMAEDAVACEYNTEIIAGQNTEVGLVKIIHPSGSSDELKFKMYTGDGWFMTEIHMHIALDPDDIPQNNAGNPKIGHFDWNIELDPALKYYLIVADLDDYVTPCDGKYKGTLYVAIHFVVQKTTYEYDVYGNCITVVQEETGWADTYGIPFNEDHGAWGYYLEIEL